MKIKLKDKIGNIFLYSFISLYLGITCLDSVYNYIRWDKAPIIKYVWKKEDSLRDFADAEGLRVTTLQNQAEYNKYFRRVYKLNLESIERIRISDLYWGYEYYPKIGSSLNLPDINRDEKVGPR